MTTPDTAAIIKAADDLIAWRTQDCPVGDPHDTYPDDLWSAVASPEAVRALADELERLRAQVLHLVDDLTEEVAGEDEATYYRLRDGKDVLFSNMVGACARLLAAPAQQAQSKPDQETVQALTVGDERGLALWQLIYGAIAHEPLPLKVGQIERAAKRVEDMLKRRAAAQAEPVAWEVWWGLGEMRRFGSYESREKAEAIANGIRSNTEVREVRAPSNPPAQNKDAD